jgi:hypothetical protein
MGVTTPPFSQHSLTLELEEKECVWLQYSSLPSLSASHWLPAVTEQHCSPGTSGHKTQVLMLKFWAPQFLLNSHQKTLKKIV